MNTIIPKQQMIDWLFHFSEAEKSFEAYYRDHGAYLTFDMLPALDPASPYYAAAGVNTDFRSLQSNYRQQMDYALSFSEMDWFVPFFDVSIQKHLPYMEPFLHKHAFFELCYVLRGSCVHVIDHMPGERRLPLSEGDILVIPPGLRHSITMDSESIVCNILLRQSTFRTSFLNNMPTGNLLHTFFSETLFNEQNQSYILFHTGYDQVPQEIFLVLAEEYTNGLIYSNSILNQMISVFLGKLMQRHSSSIELITEDRQHLDFLSQVLQYMEENYASCTVQSVAGHFNYNASYLSLQLKKTTGYSLMDTLLHIRITRARELLESTSISVELITEAIGYTDTTYFIRIFKKHTGLTPYQYRKKHTVQT